MRTHERLHFAAGATGLPIADKAPIVRVDAPVWSALVIIGDTIDEAVHRAVTALFRDTPP